MLADSQLGPIALVDVHYLGDGARAACVLAEHWTDATPRAAWTVDIARVAPYLPGEFFRRELPCLVQVLAQAREPLGVIVVDGYVVLDEDERLGLGGHLFQHFAGSVPVVGIAKRAFAGSEFATRVLRGESQSPLFVTALGVPVHDAAGWVEKMAGPYRIPTLCTWVDQLCRGLRASPGT